MSSTHYPITREVAHSSLSLAACSYVGVLYLFSSTRTRPLEIDQKGRRLDRLNPDILKARLWAVSASSLFSLFLVGLLVRISSEHQALNPHVHGIWESYRTLGGTRKALMIATIQTLVQFIYTTIFGCDYFELFDRFYSGLGFCCGIGLRNQIYSEVIFLGLK
ncbi:hypothetical protein H4Q26_015725 [Puccinia striiformis f. sp. tritici PST-130]|nr:hypothetical protein H4Q26_015725 [Puccinia striiformis f. sp. tritici PST-130]